MEVAIIGMGCRVPGACGPRGFWRQLTSGRGPTEWSPDGPIHTTAFETTVEALDDAGIGYRVRGSDTAVVFGTTSPASTTTVPGLLPQDAGAESAPGSVVDYLSAALDLHGPLVMLDSVRSSSLAMVDLGVRLLADATVPLVIVGALDHCPAVLVLQRLADARSEGNRVYAEIAGVATGNTRTAWQRAGHEAGAATYSYPEVGLIGLVEAALAVHNADVPPTPGWHHAGRVGTESRRRAAAWSRWRQIAPADRYVRVTCLRSAGTGTHIVLRGTTEPVPDRDTDPPVLIPLSERDPESLRQTADDWAAELADSSRPLREMAAAAGRVMTEPVRAAVLACNRLDATAGLQSLADYQATDRDVASPDEPASDAGASSAAALTVTPAGRTGAVVAQARRAPNVQAVGTADRGSGGLLWLFSCPGGYHARMGRALAARYPVFAQALMDIADAVVQAGGPRVWTPRHGFSGNLDDVVGVQLATFAYQVALARLLYSWGVRPDAVAGHGAGEVAAAVVCQALSLSDGARLALARGRLLGQAARVSTALVSASPEQATELLQSCCPETRSQTQAVVSLAAIHGPRSVVVAGPRRHIDAVVRRARRQRLVATHAAADLAGLGPAAPELAPEFSDVLGQLTGNAPQLSWYSPVRQGQCVTTELDAQYWTDNARGVVDLAAVLDCAAAAGTSTVLELAPHAILTPAIADHPDFRGAAIATTSFAGRQTTGRETTGRETVVADEATGYLRAIACLFVRGQFVDWSAAGSFTGPVLDRHWRNSQPDRARRQAALPTDPGASVPASYWLQHLLQSAGNGCTRLTDVLLCTAFPAAALPEITSHVGREAVAVLLGRPDEKSADRPGPTLIASARPAAPPTPAEIVSWLRIVDAHRGAYRSMRTLGAQAYYAELYRHGLADATAPSALRLLSIGNHSAIGLFGHEAMDATSLEGCLQLAVAAATTAERQRHPVPDSMAAVWVCNAPATLLSEAHAFIRAVERTGLTADVIGLDQVGAPVVALIGIRLRFSDDATRPSDGSDETTDHEPPVPRHEVWCPIPPLPTARDTTHAPKRALVVGQSELANQLVTTVHQRVPTQQVHDPPGSASAILAALAAHPTERTAVILVWPDQPEGSTPDPATPTASNDAIAAVESHLTVLRELIGCETVTSLTVVLRDRGSLAQAAVAGLVRALRRRFAAALQLIWSEGQAGAAGQEQLPSLVLAASAFPEVLVTGSQTMARRFTPCAKPLRPDLGHHNSGHYSDSFTPIRPNGTYVVTGGLGAAGAASARWLLDCGAREVVVLTRAPRPLPPLLAEVENRIVVVHCDVRDRTELANALHDVRECGSTIHGVVHAAGLTATTPQDMAPMLAATFALLDLTASDPVDFVLLYRCAASSFGAGEPLHAAADAAVDAIARATTGRRVISVGWGGWADTTVPAVGHRELRQAGVMPLNAVRAAAILPAILCQPEPSVVAVDFRPGGRSPLAGELAALLLDSWPAGLDEIP